ncbi:UDP-3-O-(3-hydroxymyristoyl)glucosamine N-acyltransferase [Simkania negevensis]|uniref:UDP-3-O-acylglucosamine N-acyltransferase n=1 Tax=Simkania negevensis TaxID=83561 RepID=A0ABS3AS69_9BACT|nr:UDP-3-O-(3-hydroxymyristoyl)glucosamine N-acyltransferase [Simkania negevensis]
MQSNGLSLEEIARRTGGVVIGNPSYVVVAVSDLESASDQEISFLANPRYILAMKSSKAGAIIVASDEYTSPGRNYIVTDNPTEAFQDILEYFHPHAGESDTAFVGVHPTAVVDPTAEISPGVTLGPYAVVDAAAVIGEGSLIGPYCYIGKKVQVGKQCRLYSRVTVREFCIVGDRVIVQPGVVIGSCGFGYTTDEKGVHHKLKQVGNVVVEDDVEIGANTTIDRGHFRPTRIGRGTKVDNLVMIAHGVIVGEDNFVVAQTGIAGSSKTGKHVILAGQTAVSGHLSIADGVIVAGKSGVWKSLKNPGKYAGNPAIPLQENNRQQVYIRNIEKFVRRIEELEKRLNKLEE